MRSPHLFVGKLEKIYMPNSLTNRVSLKKQLYGLKMSEGTDVRNHINQFNKYYSVVKFGGKDRS